MVGNLVSFWDALFSGAMLVSGRVDTNTHSWQNSFWKNSRFAASPGSEMLMMWSTQSNIRNHVKSIYDINNPALVG